MKIGAIMKEIKCTNSNKSVRFFRNGPEDIMVFACQEGEFWFTVGSYKTLKGAKRSAVRKMSDHGYKVDMNALNKLSI